MSQVGMNGALGLDPIARSKIGGGTPTSPGTNAYKRDARSLSHDVTMTSRPGRKGRPEQVATIS